MTFRIISSAFLLTILLIQASISLKSNNQNEKFLSVHKTESSNTNTSIRKKTSITICYNLNLGRHSSTF